MATFWDKGGTINFHITYPPLLDDAICLTDYVVSVYKFQQFNTKEPDWIES